MPISPIIKGAIGGPVKPKTAATGTAAGVRPLPASQAEPTPGGTLTLARPVGVQPEGQPAAASTADIDAQARAQVDGDIAAGTDWANSVLPDGTLGRLDNKYGGAIDDYVTQLRGRTGGMTQQELLAQQEQGIASADQLLAQNLRRAGAIAGNAGVRGGAAAGLQMDALRDNTQQRAQLQRQLVLDNIAQKNQAFAAYGGALQDASGLDLGIQEYNNSSVAKEKLGRTELALQKGGLYDSARSGLKADSAAADSTKLAKDFLDWQKSQVSGGNQAPADPTKATENRDTRAVFDSIVNEIVASSSKSADGKVAPSGMPIFGSDAGLKAKVQEYVDLSYPDLTDAERSQKVREEYYNAFRKAGYPEEMLRWADAPGSAGGAGAPSTQQGNTIICTEAMHQGLVSQEVYQAARGAEPVLGYRTLRNYWVWGVPTVNLMKRSPAVARVLAWFLPDTVAAIHGNPHQFRGAVGHAVFRSLTSLVGAYRFLTHSFPTRNLKEVSRGNS